MEPALTWDKDGDGLIENSGKPDQTFDSWVRIFLPFKTAVMNQYEQHHIIFNYLRCIVSHEWAFGWGPVMAQQNVKSCCQNGA